MRLDLFCIVLLIPTAIFATMLGDGVNVAWKAWTEADDGSTVAIAIWLAVAAVLSAGAVATYIKEYLGRDISGQPKKQLMAGTLVLVSSSLGVYIWAAFVGPINNAPYGWVDGWSFVLILALMPKLLHLNICLGELVVQLRTRYANKRHGDNVERFHQKR
ncbi:hypothetical protein [Mameliella sp.]|uniref:hypothetical protein n=1 Tax=Mameliella sp. TaxID=1924940 RepID=UPI003BA95958